MQQYPLLQTKLHIPPIRSGLVRRPRLLEHLNAGLDRKLSLMSAPAGFGKTTLVSEWLDDLRVDAAGETRIVGGTAWLSLDEGDNDPTRFLAYLTAALQTIEPDIGKGMSVALQSSEPPPAEAALASLINDIAAIPATMILALDDYHLINAQPIYDALAFLLKHLPPRMHLVIATREDPHLPLARLRARGQLTELRASDLRFTSSEAAEFLNRVMGLDLSAEDIAALETRTEGWIAGLQLAAISMQGHKDTTGFVKSFTGSHRFVLDYLVEEVLEQQSESVRAFLRQTSVLDRLTGPLCDALTGQDNGQATLKMLERANLFIVPLDEERRWYRYHQLFADLLRQRQRQTQLEQAPTLHHRASEWYEQNGFADEAIEHALRAGDFERAAYLIEERVDVLWQRGEHIKLRRWLAGLPVELVFSKPHLCILHAWHLFTSGQHHAAETSLQAAEQALETSIAGATETLPLQQGQPPDIDRMMLQGRMAAIRAFLACYRGDLSETIQYARQALENLPGQDSNWRGTAAIALGDAYSFRGELSAAYRARLQALEASSAGGNIYMIATLKLADTHRQQGQLRRTIELCQQQWDLAQEIGLSQTVAAGWLLAIWGEALAELNDLDGAVRQALKGVKLTERGKDVMVIGQSNLCLMRVLFSRRDLAGADKIIRKMENIARRHDVPPFITNRIAAWQARLWLARGNLGAASQWVGERRLDAVEGPTLLREVEYMVLARILVAQGRLDETASLLQRLLDTAQAGGHTSRAIEILMLQALAFQAGGEPARAMTTLDKALILAEPAGFVRIFVDEGSPMAQLLYQAAAWGMMPEYTARLLAAFEKDAMKDQGPLRATEVSPSSSAALGGPSSLLEPLSERELVVLQLIAEGLTNREIASRLFLSLNTVKAHTRSIYGKLGVGSRTQAVARARASGVLSFI
jgi:LuxR family maltose regulon positive regulatory protein